jgi:protein-S-isoprenylcysteine O-methyltransferase Ste14
MPAMNVGPLAFRFRALIFLLLYVAGFLTPWERFRGRGNDTLWLAAATLLARTGWTSLANATITVTIAALACFVLGAVLRVWGTAYLGSNVMSDSAMQGDQVVAGGPYGYVRNPLYLGGWLLAVGASILMPPSGAAFFVLSYSSFVLILIAGEERFLRAKQGGVYQQYCRSVPRLLPRIPAVDATSDARPRWPQAFFAEIYPVGFTLCFAIFAWRYNAQILIQCLLIFYGLSLIGRALGKRTVSQAEAKTDFR